MAGRNKIVMIRGFNHRVLLCRQKDVVVEGSSLRLLRESVIKMWAMIEPKKASTFTPNGATMMENRNKRTHLIKTRYRPNLEISNLAWLYEERRKSAPRWFKILEVSQTEHGSNGTVFVFECRLIERGDDIAEPVQDDDGRKGPLAGLPDGVSL